MDAGIVIGNLHLFNTHNKRSNKILLIKILGESNSIFHSCSIDGYVKAIFMQHTIIEHGTRDRIHNSWFFLSTKYLIKHDNEMCNKVCPLSC